jgi:hypothetical protein
MFLRVVPLRMPTLWRKVWNIKISSVLYTFIFNVNRLNKDPLALASPSFTVLLTVKMPR